MKEETHYCMSFETLEAIMTFQDRYLKSGGAGALADLLKLVAHDADTYPKFTSYEETDDAPESLDTAYECSVRGCRSRG